MDFSLSEAQHDLAALARRIAGDAVERDPGRELGGFDPALWRTMAEAGLLDAALPASVGGGGFGLLERCTVAIEVGRAAAPVPYPTSIAGVAATIADLGSGQHTERWLLPMVRGQRTMTAALADEGSVTGLTAARAGGRWRISGGQTAVLDGAFAGGYLCEASTPDGDALFLVDRDSTGVTVSEQQTVDGAGAALVELDEVVASEDALLGSPGDGSAGLLRQRLTVALCAHQFGVLERALEMTAEYAKKREQFDSPIGSFQAVRQRLADAYLDVEAVRLTLWQAAWRLSAGLPAGAEVATAKFWAAQAGHRVAHTTVHVHGGVGIDLDYPLHRYFVAAKRNEFAIGGATAQLRALGTLLAEEPA